MADLKTNTTQRAETVLTSTLAAGGTTINVSDTSDFPAVPFYGHLAPEPDSTTFEEVLVDSSKTSTTFVLTASSKRGQGGTTDREHPSGTVFAVVPSATVIRDLHDRADAIEATADAAYTPGGTDVAVADGGTGASTAASARTNLGAAADSEVVKLTGAQTIAGAKTFSTDPTLADGSSALSVTEGNAAYAAITHASRHSNGGADEVTVENLGTAATDTDLVLKPDGSGGLAFGAPAGVTSTVVYKSADESVTSSTTFQADDTLVLPVAANETWVVEIVLFFTGDSSADLKLYLDQPSGSTVGYAALGPAITASGSGDANFEYRTGAQISTLGATTGGAGTIIRAFIANGATAGNLTLMWAQNSSNGVATTVKAGSHLAAHKVS